MLDYIKENPGRFLVTGACLAVAGILTVNWLNERKANSGDGPTPPGSEHQAGAQANDPLKEISRLQYKEPLQALNLLEGILRQPKSKEQAAQAKDLLPTVLNLAFHNRLKAKEPASAKSYLDRLEKEFPQHFQTRGTRDSWGRDLGERAKQALNAGQEDEAAKLLEEIVQGGHVKFNTYLLGEMQKHLGAKAEAAQGSSNAAQAEQYLEKAARILTEAGMGSGLVRQLRGGKWDSEQLQTLAEKWVAAGKQPLSLPLYQAARLLLNEGRGRPNYEERQKLMNALNQHAFDALLLIGDELAAGRSPVISALTPQQLYQEAVSTIQAPEQRIKALRRKMAVEEKAFDELAKPILAHRTETMVSKQGLEYEAVNQIYSQCHEARRAFHDLAIQTAGNIWGESRRLPAFDPWVQANASVKAQAWREYPESGQEEQRRQLLEKIHREANWPLPLEGVQEAEEKMCEIYLRWGLLSWHSGRDEGTRMLRIALAHTRNPYLRNQVAQGAQEFIRRSRAKKDFDALYEFTVFYTGEYVEIKRDDPFRKELFAGLTESAKYFQNRSAMKRIFMLSLLNEGFPETPEGKNALTDGLQQSFAAAQAQPEDTKGAPALGSSPVEGHSAIAVDNGTEYHILCFYQGPETFFIRIPPYRRGSLALKNGDYRVAVICTSDTIRPYRGAFRMNGEQRKSAYTVVRSGDRTESTRGFGSAASGDYTLLRSPEGLASVKVDPRTGLLAR